VQMLFGIAPAIAPIIGGLLLGIRWQAIFIFLAIYAALAVFAAVKFLPETMPVDKRRPLTVNSVYTAYKTIFSDAEYTKLVIAVGANFSGFFVYVLGSAVFLGQHLELGPTEYGYLFVPTVTGMILGSYFAKWAAGKVSSSKVLRFAYAWMLAMACINIAICTFVPTGLINILPIALYNIGMALCVPIVSLAALNRHPKIRGTAASGQAFMQMLFSTVSAGLIVPLVWDTPLNLAVTMMVYVLIGLLTVRLTQLWSAKA